MMHQQQAHPSMRQAPFVQEQSGQIINGHPDQGSRSREAESYLDANSSTSNVSNMATPGTDISGTSHESQASSTGTIPDFPAPMPAVVKPSALGPPPSARRGPPSLYSANLAVTPITEETPRAPAFDPTTSYLADKTPDESGRREQSPTFFDAGASDDDDAHIEQGIVRSASMGRRRKPTMVSHQNRNSDKTQEGGVLGKTRALMGAGLIAGAGTNSPAASKTQLAQAIQAGQQKEQPPPIPTIVHPAYREKEKPQWPTFGGDDSPTENKELDLMSSDSGSTLATPTPGEHEMKQLAPVAVAARARHLSPSPGPQPFGNSGLGPGKEKDGLTALGEIQYNRHSAIRRPPKLNLNAVRDAEARGSLTSLPDLIRRATKLASMMNEGKRPASRLNGLNDFPMENSEKGSLGSYHPWSFSYRRGLKLTHYPAPNTRLSGLSGMLAAFPPPGANGTPLQTPHSAHWPGYASSTKGLRTPHGEEHPKARRRCCGMPLWLFILSLLILLCIIAAAVVVPLKLTVLKDKDPKAPVVGTTAIEVCQRDAACLNGGTSQLDGSTCVCICANGYEGARCDSLGKQGCTTVNYFGTDSGEKFEKITVGNAIPRLVDGSDAKFSVPLFYENLINQFGKGEVSCSGGNALVAINGETGAEEVSSSSASSSATKASSTPAPSGSGAVGVLDRRQDVDTEIALATGTQTAPVGKATGAATSIIAAPTAKPTGSSSAKAGNITVSHETLDFARVAVLYVVQERSVKEALSAQEAVIEAFKGVEIAGKKNGTMPTSNSVVTWTNGSGGTGFIDLGTWNVGMGASGGKEAKKVGGRGRNGTRIY